MYAVEVAATIKVSRTVTVWRAVARFVEVETMVMLGSTHSDEPDIDARPVAHGVHVVDELAPTSVENVLGAHFEQELESVVEENFPATHGEHSSLTLGEKPGGHVCGHARRKA